MEIEKNYHKDEEPIAIIGMGCRFPGGVTTPDAYWELLKSGTNAISEVPPDRWSNALFYSSRKRPGKINTLYGGFINQIEWFDPYFFGISPHEAVWVDPQQRLLLEIAWEALEDGGQRPSELGGKPVGVFIGALSLDYHTLQFSDMLQYDMGPYTSTGCMGTMLSNRLSYIFNLRGPSLTIDTACSSSLVAVHYACESLRRGESLIAIAGGVTLMFTPQHSIAEAKGGFLSPSGRCKSFDADADGYVRGEGAGVVILKPLDQAMADHDPVQAVILGSAVNQDGRTKGITVPNPQAQKEVLRIAYRQAKVDPARVRYIEAHGTGTPVGDPIEANSLGEFFSSHRPGDEELFIGSCKTNIGHTEAAAGIAGLIKAVLCLKHKEIPPNLHFHQPNPKIDLQKYRLKVPTTLMKWPDSSESLVCGVNSFGYGGTNAHLVIQAVNYCPGKIAEEPGTLIRPLLLPISARNKTALRDYVKAYSRLQAGLSLAALYDLCFSASVKRDHHEFRIGIIFNNNPDLTAELQGYLREGIAPSIMAGHTSGRECPKLVWVFSGMGAPWWGMGRELLEKETVFREKIILCDRLYQEIAGWSLLEELKRDEGTSRMNQAWVAQPANFALQIALAALWRSWGINPDAILGHSVGEIAAFYEAGVLELKDALMLVYCRSKLLRRLEGQGAMLAAGISPAEAVEICRSFPLVSLAALNSPTTVVLTGNREGLAVIAAELDRKGKFNRFLRVNIPYHSPLLEEILEEFGEMIREVKPRPSTGLLYSTVTGTLSDGLEAGPRYWQRNMRETVKFAPVVNSLIDSGYHTFLEIGPHPVLTVPIAECLGGEEGTLLYSLHKKEKDQQTMLRSLAVLYTLGFAIDWQVLYPGGNYIPLPSYPWQREKYWVEPEQGRRVRLGIKDHPLLGIRLPQAGPVWENEISLEKMAFLADHSVGGRILYPGACYIEAAYGALQTFFGCWFFVLENIEFKKSITLTEQNIIQFHLDTEESKFSVYGATDFHRTDLELRATGRIRQIPGAFGNRIADFTKLRAGLTTHCLAETAYSLLKEMGFTYGPAFQGIRESYLGKDEALAEIGLPGGETVDPAFLFHPVLLDGSFQTLLLADLDTEDPKKARDIQIPVRIESLRILKPAPERIFAYARVVERNDYSTIGDLTVYDAAGAMVAEIRGFVKQSLDTAAVRLNEKLIEDWTYETIWMPKNNPHFNSNPLTPFQQVAIGTQHWVIFADRGGLGERLAKLLSTRNIASVLVFPGDNYISSDNQTIFWLPPSDEAAYYRLFRDLTSGGELLCQQLIHLWSLDSPAGDLITLPEYEHGRAAGCHSVLGIIKALETLRLPSKLWLVTSNTWPAGSDPGGLNIFQAPLWGLGRIIGHQEFINNWGGMIDLPLNQAGVDEAELILAEILKPDGEDQIAWRAEGRFVLRMRKAAHLTPALPARFLADGAYLITGAFGALGREVTAEMVRCGARHLVLLGRSKIPERSEWERIEPDSGLGKKIAYLRQLEKEGAMIYYAPVDVANEAQLAGFLRDFKAEGGPPLRGVMHCAGVVKDRLLTQMDTETFNSVLAPKVWGTWLLHKYLSQEPLDYFVLFSSIAALISFPGQGNYAAANTFLEALVSYRRLLGLPGLCIHWGPWTLGMARDLNLIEHFWTEGITCFSPGEGLQLWKRLIAQNAGQFGVIQVDWNRLFQVLPFCPPMTSGLREKLPLATVTGDCSAGNFVKKLDLAMTSEAKEAIIRDYLFDLIVEKMNFDRELLDENSSLPALGLDSLMAVIMRARIFQDTGVALLAGELLSDQPIREIVAIIVKGIKAS